MYRWALFDRDPLKTFDFGSVTLLGDAAHPLLPYGVVSNLSAAASFAASVFSTTAFSAAICFAAICFAAISSAAVSSAAAVSIVSPMLLLLPP